MFKITSRAGISNNIDYRGAAAISEKNRDDFRLLFISRLMIAVLTSFLAVFGYAFTQSKGGEIPALFIWPLWFLFFSLIFSLLAGLSITAAFNEESERNKLAGNADSKLRAGHGVAKQREDYEQGVLVFNEVLRASNVGPPISVEFVDHDNKIEEAANDHLSMGLKSLHHAKSAKDMFKFTQTVAVLSILCLLVAFLIPMIRISIQV